MSYAEQLIKAVLKHKNGRVVEWMWCKDELISIAEKAEQQESEEWAQK